MAEQGEDFINLRHDVDRHETDLDHQLKKIQELEKEVSELKGENAELKISLQKTVLLIQKVYAYLGVDKTSMRAEQIRLNFVKDFNDVRSRLGMTE